MKAINVVSNRVYIVHVDTRVPQEVILNELSDAESLEVLKLEEVEDEIIYLAVAELHFTIAWVIHVDRGDSWGNHLNKFEVRNSITLRGH